jgi:hypothetical protein
MTRFRGDWRRLNGRRGSDQRRLRGYMKSELQDPSLGMTGLAVPTQYIEGRYSAEEEVWE